jgi:Myb/SANT-like DNA-binding domain
MIHAPKVSKSGKEKSPPVSWTASMRNQFILVLISIADGKVVQMGFKSTEWTEITNIFNIRMGMSVTRQQLQNQYTTLKSSFSVFHVFSQQSGFAIDNVSKLVTGDPFAMRDYFRAFPKAKEYEFKTLMFYDNLHILFEGRIATGRHAAVFSSPAAVVPAAKKRAIDPEEWKEHTGLTGAYDDVPGGGSFNYSAEEGSENEDDNVLSLEYFKRLEVKRVKAADPGPSHSAANPVSSAVKAAPAVTPKSGPARQMREKPAEQVSRMLGVIVDNQKMLLNRLPLALHLFDETYATALTVMQKIKVKSYLGKDNNAEIFSILCHDERTEFVNEIITM